MKIIVYLLLATLFCGCESSTVFKAYDRNFSDNRWLRSDARSYDFVIAEPGNYDVIIDFGHVAGSQFAVVPIMVEVIYPDKSISTATAKLTLTDALGKNAGDCAGDLCDVEHFLFRNEALQKGKYRITLTNAFDYNYLPNVIGLGLKVNKTDK